jgi:uncharacterized membrane protein
MPRKLTLRETLPYILLIGGMVGIFCAGALTLDKIELLKHPAAQLNCDLNPIVACGPVINKPQASAFGVPNPLIGLVGFAVTATVGGAMLAGAAFRRWFWLGLEAGLIFAVAFVTWLQFQTIFRINALCPFCMAVWAVTIPMFWYTTLYNLREGNIKVRGKLVSIAEFLQRHHGDVLVTWFLVILAVILNHFWYYWKTVL